MERHGLTDREWVRLRPLLPSRARTRRPVRYHLRRYGIGAVIPQPRTEKTARPMDQRLCRERNVVERLVGRLKEYRRIATRYDKLAATTWFSSGSLRSVCGFENEA